VHTKEDRNSLIAKAQEVLNTKPFGKQQEATFNAYMKLLDALDADSRHERATEVVRELRTEERQTRALRAESEFKGFVHRGEAENRTYSALEAGSVGGSYLVPAGQWRREYVARLTSASGWLQAGANFHISKTGRPYFSFASDDASNVASIIAEDQMIPQANPTFAKPVTNYKKFATALTTSMELEQDVDESFDLNSYLQYMFGKRVGRKFNDYATNDGTDGLLAQITVGVTSVSSSAPSLAELSDLQYAVDPAYLEADSLPVYMGSETMKTRLLKAVTSAGEQLFPSLNDGKLLGLPYVVNSSMTANAGDVALVMGSIKRGVNVQSDAPVLIRSAERFVEYGQTFFAFVNRIGAKLVDSKAVTALSLHA
jgi:HK97 family phage major capsid protein